MESFSIRNIYTWPVAFISQYKTKMRTSTQNIYEIRELNIDIKLPG